MIVTEELATNLEHPFGPRYALGKLSVEMNLIGLKVFAATKARDRELLGETITAWIRSHTEFEVFDKIVTQSSDAEFHCLAITLAYRFRK